MKWGAAMAAAVVAVATTAAGVRAQPGPFVAWGRTGEVGIRWESAQGRAEDRPRVSEGTTRAWLGASLQGQIADRRALAWSWAVRPGFVRSGGSEPFAEATTRELAHQFTASTRPWPWLSGQFSADRDRVVADRGADASRESRFARVEGRGDLRLPCAGLGASLRRERADERWMSTALAPELERHTNRRTADVWLESSRMRLQEHRTTERVPETGADVRTRQTTFDHVFSWGHGSALRTRLEWAGQTPVTAALVERLVHENLRVRHASWLTSEYAYRTTRARLAAGGARDASHALELSARTDGVGAGLGASFRHDRSPGREGRAWSAGPRVIGQRAWKGGTRAAVEAGMRLERERRTGADDARVPVVNEAHAVGATRTFSLEVEGVDSATVFVRDAAGASGYVEGADYLLLRSGTRLFVVIPPGSRIAVGDVLHVSYEASPPGVPERRGTRWDMGASAEWRALSVRLDDRLRVVHDTPLERGGSALGSREQSASLAASLPRGPTRVDLSVAFRRRTVDARVADTRDARAALTWSFAPAILGTFDVLGSAAREPGGRLDALVVRGRLDWKPGTGRRANLHAERSRFIHEHSRDIVQTVAGAEVGSRWSQLDTWARLDLGTRGGDAAGHTFARVTIAATRKL